MDTSVKYYIYIYTHNGVPRYVGKGKGNRCLIHLKPDCNGSNRKREYFVKYRDELRVEILPGLMTEEVALRREKVMIAIIGREDLGKGTLLNVTNGGDGIDWTPEARAKISKASLGRKHGPEARAKISKAKRGRKRSLETRAKISAANYRRWTVSTHSPEALAKMAEAARGRKFSPETRAKLARAARQQWAMRDQGGDIY